MLYVFWSQLGRERRPSAEAYAELLERSLRALEGTTPLLLGDAIPHLCLAACTADGLHVVAGSVSGTLVRLDVRGGMRAAGRY